MATTLIPDAHGALSPRERLEALTELDDGGRRLRALPPDELHALILEVGLEDATEAVRLSSAEQFRALVDLDAWRRNQPDLDRALLWLRAARGPGGRRYLRKLETLDIELFELLLKQRLEVHDLTQDPEADTRGTPWRSFDGYFLVGLPDDPLQAHTLQQLLTDLYAQDAGRAQRILTALGSELVSELEEQALRWRTARLEDLGFPPLEKAVELYAKRARPARPERSKGPTIPRTAMTATASGPDLFRRALAELPPEEADIVVAGLRGVGNQALVADAVDLGDAVRAREVLERVQATLSLGLAELAGAEEDGSAGRRAEAEGPEHPKAEDAAARCLVSSALREIFQVGFTKTLELQWAAARALAEGPLRLPGERETVLDPPDRDLFAALAQRRPIFPGALDGPGAPARPFRTPQDLALAREALARAERLGRLVQAAGLDLSVAAKLFEPYAGLHPPSTLRLSDLYLTALAHEIIGTLGPLGRSDPAASSFVPAPLRPSEATRALEVAFGSNPEGPRPVALLPEPRPELVAAGHGRLRRAAPSMGPEALADADRFWALCLQRLRDEVGRPASRGEPLPPGGPWKLVPE